MTGYTDSRWGLALWGSTLWGDSPDVDYAGVQAGCKADTLLYATSADPDADLSQMETTLTTDSGAEYTTGATHLVGVDDFSIEALASFDNTDTGVIVGATATSGTNDFKVEVVSGGDVRFTYGHGANQTVLDVTPPNLSASAEDYAIQAVVEPNPITTGSSDAVLLRLTVVDTDDLDDPANYAQATAVGPRDPTMNVDRFFLWGSWDGATMSSVFSGTQTSVRFSARPHSFSEFRYDLLDSAPDPTAPEGEVPPGLPRRTDTIGGEEEFAGPAHMMAGATHMARRLGYAGPLWCFGANEPPDIDLDDEAFGFGAAATFGAWLYELPGGSGFRTHIGLFANPPVPTWATHARVHVRLSSNGGMEVETNTNIRCVSQDQKPLPSNGGKGLGGAPGTDVIRYSRDAVYDHNSQDTAGEWILVGDVELAVDPNGDTWLMIFLEDSTGDAEVRVDGTCWDPIRKVTDGTAPGFGGLVPP